MAKEKNGMAPFIKVTVVCGTVVTVAAAGGVLAQFAPWVHQDEMKVYTKGIEKAKDDHHRLWGEIKVAASETADRAIRNEINYLNRTLINLLPALDAAKKRHDRTTIKSLEEQKKSIEQDIEELQKQKGTLFK